MDPRSSSFDDDKKSENLADIVRHWAHGWVLSRSTPAALDHGTHLSIAVDRPGHRLRHVLLGPPDDALRSLAHAHAGEDGVWLKVPAAREAVAPWLPAGWTLQPREYLMRADLVTQAGNGAAAPRGIVVERRGALLVAARAAPDGQPVARAQAALAGGAAIFDQVVTEPAHRRQGHGAALMRALAAVACENRARCGLLVATGEGRRLYESLGWTVATEITAASSAASR